MHSGSTGPGGTLSLRFMSFNFSGWQEERGLPSIGDEESGRGPKEGE